MNRLFSPWFAAAAVAAVIGLGFLLDGISAPPEPVETAPVTAPPATAGAAFCGVGQPGDDGAFEVVAAAPPADGSRPSQVAVNSFRDGTLESLREGPVFPSSSATVPVVTGPEGTGIVTRWRGAPSATTRIWRPQEATTPPTVVAGPCPTSTSPRWVVPGLATAGGATADLVIANPFGSDAAVSVAFTTPNGLREPRLLANIAVSGRSVKTISVNEHAPAEPDLGAIVTVRSGRAIVEGIQRLDAAIGGVNAASLATAAPTAATTWTVPWFEVDGDTSESWLWVTNPDDVSASLTLTLHTDTGGTVPEGLVELDVGPGQVRRVDLRDLVPATQAAVTVRSDNGVPVVVSGVTRMQLGSPERSGMAVQLAQPETASTWVLTMPLGADRASVVHLANPAGEDAVVSISLWGGAGVIRPPELARITIPPGGVTARTLTEHLPQTEGTATAFVEAETGAVVAGVESMVDPADGEDGEGEAGSPGSALELVAYPGVPSTLWAGGGSVPPVSYGASLAETLGTELGVLPPEPFGAEGPDPEEQPATREPTATDEPRPTPG